MTTYRFVNFDADSIKSYIDECIIFWRNADDDFAEYYIDAFQSVRKSIFGELLRENNGNKNGEAFLTRCREIIEECGRLPSPERAARVAVFGLCVMLDGSGESTGPEYVLSVRNDDGELEPVEFFHHDL